MSTEHIPLEKVRECLERSGYLLESRLVRSLTDHGYFVEPNQIVRDPRTGKGREIDLVAEYFDYNHERQKVCVKTNFVVEAINNKFPFTLLTERPNSPGADFESYIKVAYTPEPNPFLAHFDIYEEKGADWKNLFSQYCVLTKKNGGNKELMATHPDDVYSSLKISEYIEDQIHSWATRDGLEHDNYWRNLGVNLGVKSCNNIKDSHLPGNAVLLKEHCVGAGPDFTRGSCISLFHFIFSDAYLRRVGCTHYA